MSWTTPETFNVGDKTGLAAKLNRNVRDNVLAISSIPAVRAHNQGAHTVTTGAPSAVVFDIDEFDTDNDMHPAGDLTRFFARTAGKYLCCATAMWTANPVNATIYLMKNSVSEAARSGMVGDYRVMNVTTIINLTAGEHMQVQVNQDSGATIAIAVGAHFEMQRLSE